MKEFGSAKKKKKTENGKRSNHACGRNARELILPLHGATHAVADGHMYGMQRLSYDLLNLSVANEESYPTTCVFLQHVRMNTLY